MESKRSEIRIGVELDENNVPQDIRWMASDTDVNTAAAKAFMLSVWDPKENNTLRMDLWTKEMTVEEMKKFTYQHLTTLADTFERATGEKNMGGAIREFARMFGLEMQVIRED